MANSGDVKLAMVMAVSEVLRVRKGKKDFSHEEMMKDIEHFIHNTRNKDARLMMVVAASKTLDFVNRNPKMSDKEVIKSMVGNFDSLIETAEME